MCVCVCTNMCAVSACVHESTPLSEEDIGFTNSTTHCPNPLQQKLSLNLKLARWYPNVPTPYGARVAGAYVTMHSFSPGLFGI